MSCFPLSHTESVKEVGEYGLRHVKNIQSELSL